jgi:putative PIN family toxin of toxin-antitoxin system
MKIVFDANVLIAAFAAHGLCEAIYELCLANDTIFLTREILKDVREKLVKKIKLPTAQAEAVIALIENNATIVTAADLPPSLCRDPDDVNILGAAKAANADYIISGDKDLWVLQSYGSAKIVKPREYWEEFSRRKK